MVHIKSLLPFKQSYPDDKIIVLVLSIRRFSILRIFTISPKEQKRILCEGRASSLSQGFLLHLSLLFNYQKVMVRVNISITSTAIWPSIHNLHPDICGKPLSISFYLFLIGCSFAIRKQLLGPILLYHKWW